MHPAVPSSISVYPDDGDDDGDERTGLGFATQIPRMISTKRLSFLRKKLSDCSMFGIRAPTRAAPTQPATPACQYFASRPPCRRLLPVFRCVPCLHLPFCLALPIYCAVVQAYAAAGGWKDGRMEGWNEGGTNFGPNNPPASSWCNVLQQ